MAKQKSDLKKLKYTTDPREFEKFIYRLRCDKLREPLGNTLANIFTMRYIGNKTHGDMAEVGLTEFINLFMYDFKCIHVGKEFFRSKEHEEDIAILDSTNPDNEDYIPVSLKAYGLGPLQLSTDKDNILYNYLKNLQCNDICGKAIDEVLKKIKNSVLFNVIPLIYKESKKGNKCNIFIFNAEKLNNNLKRIVFVGKGKEFSHEEGKVVERKGRKKKRVHPIFMFLDENNNYICEVRYGGKTANALQRGLWSDTKKGEKYFTKLFGDWIEYDKQEELLSLFRRALNSTREGHENANGCLNDNINNIIKTSGLK